MIKLFRTLERNSRALPQDSLGGKKVKNDILRAVTYRPPASEQNKKERKINSGKGR